MTISQDTSTPIELAVVDGIATLTLNRPEARNAISDTMRSLLIELLEQVAADPAIKALVVTGAGKGFCAGGDIKGMQARMSAPAGSVAFNGWKRQQRVHHAVSLLHNMPKPTIAAVNGAATGLGCDMALSCDFIIASEQASFAMSYIARGLIPDGGGLYFLPRRVGLPKAKELIFSGRMVAPQEAQQIGMIDRVVPHDNLLPAAQDWALQLPGWCLADSLSSTADARWTFAHRLLPVLSWLAVRCFVCDSGYSRECLGTQFSLMPSQAVPGIPRRLMESLSVNLECRREVTEKWSLKRVRSFRLIQAQSMRASWQMH